MAIYITHMRDIIAQPRIENTIPIQTVLSAMNHLLCQIANSGWMYIA